MNNVSRNVFSNFCNNTGHVRVNKRNVFYKVVNGKLVKIAFCVVSDENNMFCRQFYEDCVGVVFYVKGKMLYSDKKQLILDKSPNRITTDGIKAFTAKPISTTNFVG